MARANEILVGRFNNALKKLFGMKGPAPSPQLGSELAPTITMFYGVENRFLEQWDRFGFALNVAAVVGQSGEVQVRNPAGSNVIAVVEKIAAFGQAAADQLIISSGAKTADLATAQTGTNIRFDPRGRPQSSLVISTQTAAAPIDLQVRAVYGLATGVNIDCILFEEQEIPLLPGDALLVRNIVLNAGFEPALWWRERFLEDSERQ